jgi:hypothetical protein
MTQTNFLSKAILLACILLRTATAGATSSGATIDVDDSGTASGTNWTYNSGVFTVTGDVTITGNTTTNRIVVQSGATANITLDGVSITSNACAFDMTGATVHLTLAGTNTLKSGTDKAGISVPSDAKLTISGSGSLEATGGNDSYGGAGIGGDYNSAGGEIIINSGTVTAKGGNGNYGSGAAGIGGGYGGAGGAITINGGTVTATGGGANNSYLYGGAGIGGGHDGAGGYITIYDGTVKATGGYGGAGIGGGNGGAGGYITIYDGTVTATGLYGSGIGGGYGSAGGYITIKGG